ncbi:MAG: hypothetical protein KAI24_05365 [Planctomycetes bacterium]|nr:hypothetical protein [Planctomycetota bacterium]
MSAFVSGIPVACAVVVCAVGCLPAQQRLDEQVLAPVTSRFGVEGGRLTGPGAELLTAAAARHRYVVLGEYHGSPRISQFTAAFLQLVPARSACHLVLEVGPSSAKALVELAREPGGATEALGRVNAKYRVAYPGGRTMDPIPFFANVSDAAFLEAAIERGWQVHGIDQEFKWSGLFHLDRMWRALPEPERDRLHGRFEAARAALVRLQEIERTRAYRDDPKLPRLAVGFLASGEIAAFLDAAGALGARHAAVAADLRRSMEIYAANARRQYWRANELRIEQLVGGLHTSLREAAFDPARDRVVVKIGGLHAVRGLNGFSMYDVGNAVSERARAEGASSLHVAFQRRFALEDGEVVDQVDEFRHPGLRGLLRAGRPDAWTIVDLRPLRERAIYQRQFGLSDFERSYFMAVDVVVIPPPDPPAVPLLAR